MNNEKITLIELLSEDPATCPKCGSRTDFEELPEGRQSHECLNSKCLYKFIGIFEPEEKKPLNKKEQLALLKKFISKPQLSVMASLSDEDQEEAGHFNGKIAEVAEIIQGMAKTYEQDGLGDQATVYLHYFTGCMDWYITEKDMEEDQFQAFGLADLGPGFSGPELGYISITELIANNVELDIYYKPRTLASVKREKEINALSSEILELEEENKLQAEIMTEQAPNLAAIQGRREEGEAEKIYYSSLNKFNELRKQIEVLKDKRRDAKEEKK